MFPKPPMPWDFTLEEEIAAFDALKPRLLDVWESITMSDEEPHTSVVVPTVDRAAEAYNAPAPGDAVREMLASAERVLLDVDLDCFTSLSDADPTTVLPWPRSVIREYLLPPDSESFWEAVLERCVALTLAREPHHCGGLMASGELFRDVAEVLFRELLRTQLP